MSKRLMTADEVATIRFNLIAPLTAGALDKGRRYDLTREIAERGGVCEKTVRRYLAMWNEGGYEALKPKQGWSRPDSKRGEWFLDVVEAAIELRRESPSRSVADIIHILELEGAIEVGSVPRSTLQRHMQEKGFDATRMRMYTAKGAAARRFQKEHRNELWMGDIKYGPFVPDGKGNKKQMYLVVWIDDATRFVVCAKFYLNQTVTAIEDSLRLAVQRYGVPEKVFVDNGKQYRSKWMSEACAKLGVRLLTAMPYSPESKGKIERFNRTVDKFISEAIMAKPGSVAEYNELLRIWLDTYYHEKTHSALAGVSPATAFSMDSRPLRFAPAEMLRDAFLHKESRKVDKTGCVSFEGSLYEVGPAYIGRRVDIRFDPSWTDMIEVLTGQSQPVVAKKLVIGRNVDTSRELPEHMRGTQPQASRMLDALKEERARKKRPSEVATSFKEFFGGEGDV